MCPAIHISSRSWLRSSSTREPSDPPLRVVSQLLYRSRRKPPATTTIDGRSFRRRLLYCGPYGKRKKTIASGRPNGERRLFKPSQCRRRRHVGDAPPPPTRSSRRLYERSRQVPRHFYKYSLTIVTDDSRLSRFSRRAPAVRPRRVSSVNTHTRRIVRLPPR